MLSQSISIERGVTSGYQVADVVMMLAMAVLAGAKHMNHMFIIRTDSALCSLFRCPFGVEMSIWGRATVTNYNNSKRSLK